jgi:transposase InsO family protein
MPIRRSSSIGRLGSCISLIWGAELFATVAEAQGLADRWRWEYNTLRPHSALQGRKPLETAQPAAA